MEIETQFNDKQYSFIYPDGCENSYWNVARNKIILDCVKQHKINNIIDIGCGRGIVTSFLHNNNIDISGVELGNTTPISNSNVSILFNTDATSLSSEQTNRFKTISFFDVIEHIEDPVTFIKNILNYFPTVNTIILTVPARMELWTNYDDFNGHFKRYSLHEVKKELNKCGFIIKENKYFFHLLYFAIWFSRIFQNRKIRFNPPISRVSKTINLLLGNLFYIEKYFFPKCFWGSSIICVAVKEN